MIQGEFFFSVLGEEKEQTCKVKTVKEAANAARKGLGGQKDETGCYYIS